MSFTTHLQSVAVICSGHCDFLIIKQNGRISLQADGWGCVNLPSLPYLKKRTNKINKHKFPLAGHTPQQVGIYTAGWFIPPFPQCDTCDISSACFSPCEFVCVCVTINIWCQHSDLNLKWCDINIFLPPLLNIMCSCTLLGPLWPLVK